LSKPRQSAPDGRDAVLLEQMNEDLLAAVAELRATLRLAWDEALWQFSWP